MTTLDGRRLIHVTTTDMSLALLLGPQLRAFAAQGIEVIGASAPGPFVDQLTSWGIEARAAPTCDPRGVPGETISWHCPSLNTLPAPPVRTSCTRTIPSPASMVDSRPGQPGVPGIVNTVHGLYAGTGGLAEPQGRRVRFGIRRFHMLPVEFFQNPEDLEVMRRLGVPAGKLEMLGNGVDLGHLRPFAFRRWRWDWARAELGVESGSIVVGTGRSPGLAEGIQRAVRCGSPDPQSSDRKSFSSSSVPRTWRRATPSAPTTSREAEALGNVVFTGPPWRRGAPLPRF